MVGRLGLLGHSEQVVARNATDQLGVIPVDVLLRIGDQLVVRVAARIQLCGRLVAELAGRRIETDLPGRQGRLLFTYLVVNRLRPAGRDELVEVL